LVTVYGYEVVGAGERLLKAQRFMPEIANRPVFLSYASQDADAARSICEALRSGGVEVWFDQEGGLEHGDEWDAKIRRQIKECSLFIPLVSANTQARHEGYFRIEWDLAAERARGIASGVPFILPVVIDETREPDSLVPDRFRAVQWTHLPGGAVDPGVLQRFLKLWSHRSGVLSSASGRGAAPLGSTHMASRSRPRALFAASGVLVLLACGVLALWHPRRTGPLPEANADQAAIFAPRDPELRRAWDIAIGSINSGADAFALADDIVKAAASNRPADPETVIVYAWLNDSYINRGFDLSEARYALAERYSERAVALAPNDPEALGALGQYLAFRKADIPRAERLLRRAIELDPREERFYRALSWNVLSDYKPEEAMKVSERAAVLFPNDPLVHYELGLLYRNEGRIDDMERELDLTLALAPIGGATIWKAWTAAWVYGDVAGMGRWIKRMPADSRTSDRGLIIRYEFARLTQQPGDLADALQALEAMPGAKLADFFYTGPKALLIGDLFAAQAQPELARGQFGAALAELAPEKALAPANLRILMAEEWALIGLGRNAEATADARLIAGARGGPYEPKFIAWWFGEPAAYLLMGDRDSALQLIKEAARRAVPREQLRKALGIDPRMAPWRDDKAIATLLAEP
jgi:tetratricopeptide (TPR) repeat protein